MFNLSFKKYKNKPITYDLVICLWLIISIIAVYYQVIFFEFVNYDTPEYVYDNPYVKQGITLDNIVWAFSTTTLSNWHPLTWLSHMADVELFGLNSGAHHAVNVIFHIINSLILYLFIKKLSSSVWSSWFSSSVWSSWFIASLFALHPLHVQSVVWVAERKDVLSTMFGFLSIIFYYYYTQEQKQVRTYYLLVIFFFLLSLLTKPMLVTLPCILLLMDYYPLNRYNIKCLSGLLIEKIPLFILSAASSIITIYAQHSGGAMIPIENISFYSRLLNSINSYAKYIFLMFYPFDLAIIYPYPNYSENIPIYTTLFSLLFLISMSGLALWNFKKRAWLFVGWFFFIGTLVPVIGIIQVGMQAMADRYTYVPLIGLFIIIAGTIKEIINAGTIKKIINAGTIKEIINYYQNQLNEKIVKWLLSFVIILFFTVISWKQVKYWENSITIFLRAIEITQDNFIANNNLGVAFLDKQDYVKATYYFINAIKIYPDFAEAHLNYGFILANQNKTPEAMNHYQIALKLKPNYQEAYINLGNLYYREGKYSEALNQYFSAYKLNYLNVRALNGMGAVMIKKGQIDKGVYFFKRAFQINPSDPDTIHNLRKVLATTKSK